MYQVLKGVTAFILSGAQFQLFSQYLMLQYVGYSIGKFAKSYMSQVLGHDCSLNLNGKAVILGLKFAIQNIYRVCQRYKCPEL